MIMSPMAAFPALGRFVLRDRGEMVGGVVVKQITICAPAFTVKQVCVLLCV